MLIVLCPFLSTLFSVCRSQAALQVEIVALRHQIGVLRRSAKKRPKLTVADRVFWAWLSGAWADWRSALIIVKPETVIAWHRKGFRLFWTWKVRHGQSGRPAVSQEVRDLIRSMSRANPLWGAPRIHGELLKLGIDIGETSVKAAQPNLADISRQPRPTTGLGRLLHRANHPLPGSVRIPGARP